MKVTLSRDAQQIVEEQLKTHRFPNPEAVVLAALKSLAARAPDDFAAGEMESLLAEGERSIEREGTLDGDKALQARRTARGERRTGAA